MRFDIKTADELIDSRLLARWQERRHGPQADVLRWVLRAWRRQLDERAAAVDPNEWPPEMGEAPWRQEPEPAVE